jgi:hypothetical protein
MALSISEKGRRIVQLIKAVRAAVEIVPGAKVLMPEERPGAFIIGDRVAYKKQLTVGLNMHLFFSRLERPFTSIV